MAKMVYKYQDYYFEVEFEGTLLPDRLYEEFLRNCRKLIKEDRDASKAQRKELVGKDPWRPAPKELSQLRDDLAMAINKDLEQTIKNILKKNK